MEHQARYFERTLPRSGDDRERLRCYQLRIGLAEIHCAAQEPSPALLDWAIARVDEIAGRDW